jgi:hypothetical protein
VPPPDFGDLLEQSLAQIARSSPAGYARLAERMGTDRVRIDVDGTPARLCFSRGRHALARDGSEADLELRTDGAGVLALVDAELSLLDAVLADRLFVRGGVEAVARFESALVAYLEAAVRTPGLPELLGEYRLGLVRGGSLR